MKAPDFEYQRPETLAAALELLADETVDSAPLAGGQSLMPMMNFRMAAPDRLVDLNGLADLNGVRDAGDRIEIGALTRYRDLQASDLIRLHLPLMARALPHVAHAAIRNRGTLGGSVALADPAAEMPAVLLALAAEIELTGQGGARRIPADEFFLGLYETARDPGELVTAISAPKAENARFGFYELARRHGDYAMAGVCVAVTGAFDTVRIAFFGVADRAIRATGAEAALTGTQGETAAMEAAVQTLDEIEFDGDLNAAAETKRHLAGVVLRRAMEGLA